MAKVLLNFRGGFAGLREGFEALGHEVVENKWTPDEAALQGTTICVADFIDCARKLRRTLELKRRLAAAQVPFVALNRDAPFNRGVHRARLASLAWLKPFDGYAAHSMQEAERYAKRTLYCPNAARESIFLADPSSVHLLRDPRGYQWDVSFFGNLNAARYREHARRSEFLSALQARLEGTGVRALFKDSAGMTEAEQLDVIRASRVNLSAFAGCDAKETSWGLPERCYGVPATGGFLLSDRRRHAADDFRADEWADFDGLEDCVAKIRRALEHHGETRAIAERAHARVAREHGYRNRAARLLDFARHAL